jgi:hypothetical protein
VNGTHEPDEDEQSIARRLDELGIATAPDEVSELRSAYDALQAWLRIVEELGADRVHPDHPDETN